MENMSENENDLTSMDGMEALYTNTDSTSLEDMVEHQTDMD
jgi:hypothetical protein